MPTRAAASGNYSTNSGLVVQCARLLISVEQRGIVQDSASKIDIQSQWPLILRTAALLVVVGLIFFGIRAIGVERLQTFIGQAGIFAPVVYIGLRALASVVAPFGSGPLQLASGMLFGFVPALIYSVVGSTLGYCVSFWLARRYGRPMVKRLIGDSVARVDNVIDRLDSIRGLMTARLALYFAYDVVAYAAGLSRVRFIPFVLVTFILGAIPTAATIFVGLWAAGGVSVF